MTNNIPGVSTDVDIADVNGFPEAMQSALPAPLKVEADTVYSIPARQQVVAVFEPTIEGEMVIDGEFVVLDTTPPVVPDTSWDAIEGKPAEYPPEAHTHEIAEVNGLSTALSGKASSVHSHAIGDVTNLQTALDGKAASSHTHTIANVTNLQTTLDGKAASSHTHTIANVTNLQTTLDGKASTSHTHAVATTAADGFMSAADKSLVIAIRDSLAPVITSHPTTSEVYEGQTATYTVTATTLVGVLTYQHQYSADGVAWSNFTSANAASYTTNPLPASFDGAYTRVAVSNGIATSYTTPVQQGVWSPLRLSAKTSYWFDSRHGTTIEASTSTGTPASNGDPVGRWTARNNSAIYAYTTTSTARPTLSASGVAFDGVDDLLIMVGGTSATQGRAKNVYYLRTTPCTGGGRFVFGIPIQGNNALGRFLLAVHTGSVAIYSRKSDSDSTIINSVTKSLALSTLSTIGVLLDHSADKVICRIDGTEELNTAVSRASTNPTTDNTAANRAIIGASHSGSLSANNTVRHLIVFTDALTTDEQTKLEAYLAT